MNIIYSPIFPRICRKPRVKKIYILFNTEKYVQVAIGIMLLKSEVK